jgi:hypothetical protein
MSFDQKTHGVRATAPGNVGPTSARQFRLSLPDVPPLSRHSHFHRELPPEQTARFRRASVANRRPPLSHTPWC